MSFNRARWLTPAVTGESTRAEIVAVCDCFLPQVYKLAAEYRASAKQEPEWTAYRNYEEMYDKEDLDAVMIATSDHARVWSKYSAEHFVPQKASQRVCQVAYFGRWDGHLNTRTFLTIDVTRATARTVLEGFSDHAFQVATHQ